MAYPRPAYPGYRHYLPGWRYSAPVISPTAPDNTLVSASVNDTANSPASIHVTISGMQFVPSTIRIKTGDEVTWTNHEAILHAVTSPHDGSIASSSLGPGSKYSHTFNKPGIYIYYCALNTTMFGRVIVE